jgi:hypothetical protein
VTLERGHELRGRVVGPDGRPLPGASVEAWPAGTENLAWVGLCEVEADAEGRFTLRGLPGRRLTLSASHQATLTAEVDVDPLRGEDVGEVRLESRRE